jgi:hypothetical protein
MKKLSVILIFCLILTNLFAQNATINTIGSDSTIRSKIRIVHFDNSLGTIFPAEYAKILFGDNINWRNKTFITLDTALIKKIDITFIQQYCLANLNFLNNKWSLDKAYLLDNASKIEYRKAKRFNKNQLKLLEKFCPQRQNDIAFKFKQYLGFINEKGEKIIYIQLINFKEDQYNLRSRFTKDWIDGFGEWFESNTEKYYYNIDKGILSISE